MLHRTSCGGTVATVVLRLLWLLLLLLLHHLLLPIVLLLIHGRSVLLRGLASVVLLGLLLRVVLLLLLLLLRRLLLWKHLVSIETLLLFSQVKVGLSLHPASFLRMRKENHKNQALEKIADKLNKENQQTNPASCCCYRHRTLRPHCCLYTLEK